MHRFILDRTATEYFSNLVWFIRSHILDFDKILRNNREYVDTFDTHYRTIEKCVHLVLIVVVI